MTTIREGLCRNFCPYYKPSKDEELACLGFTVIERLIGKGWTIPFDTPDNGCEDKNQEGAFRGSLRGVSFLSKRL